MRGLRVGKGTREKKHGSDESLGFYTEWKLENLRVR